MSPPPEDVSEPSSVRTSVVGSVYSTACVSSSSKISIMLQNKQGPDKNMIIIVRDKTER